MPPRDPAAVLARDLADVSRHAPGDISVAVHDATGVVAQVDAQRVVPSASTIKVLVLAALLDEVDRGRLDLDDDVTLPFERVGGAGALALLPSVQQLTVGELAALMVVQSDNDAANVLVDLVGRDTIARFATTAGLTDTHLRRRFMDADAAARGEDNTTTAADMARLLAGLRAGDLLPFRMVRHAFGLMGDQQHAVGVTALLPDGVFHASKPGDLRGIRHDVAVIETPDGRWASVAVLATGMDDTRYGQDYSISVLPGFNAIGEAVHAYLQAPPAQD